MRLTLDTTFEMLLRVRVGAGRCGTVGVGMCAHTRVVVVLVAMRIESSDEAADCQHGRGDYQGNVGREPRPAVRIMRSTHKTCEYL